MNDITIDKTGWKKWRFDEFAQNISERVEPSQTDMDVYVGLEHIDPDTLHLSRHGHPSDVEGTKLRFYKGDIIFGRRRAYQRKTALATTDGICSAHAMVLRAKEDVVDPSFFPFLFHSKQFIDMAITISVGGLSPTINWKDISKQEFLLPPKSEQKRLAELLWAADEMIEKEKRELEKMEELYEHKVDSLFSDKKKISFGECANINEKSLSAKTSSEYKFHYIDIASIVSPKHLGPLTEYAFSEAPSRARRIVNYNDIVMSLVRPYLKSFVQIKNNIDNLIASTGTAVVSAKPNNDTDFLFHLLFSKAFMSFCENRMNGTNYPAITPADLGDFLIPMFNYEEQVSFSQDLNSINKNIEQIEKQIALSQEVKLELINKIF